jgi:hypothetical protein
MLQKTLQHPCRRGFMLNFACAACCSIRAAKKKTGFCVILQGKQHGSQQRKEAGVVKPQRINAARDGCVH